jgi:hypothetical protein
VWPLRNIFYKLSSTEQRREGVAAYLWLIHTKYKLQTGECWILTDYLYTVQLINPTNEVMDILMHELLFFNRWSAVLQQMDRCYQTAVL